MRPPRRITLPRASIHAFLSLIAGATLCCALSNPASAAEDWYTGASKQTQSDDWIVAVDASAAYTSNNSQFGSMSTTVALGGGNLEQSGTRLRLEGLGGAYSYASPTTGQQIHGEQFEGGALIGYQEIWKNAAVAAYMGVDVRDNSLSTADPGNGTVGTKAGIKAVAEAYLRPTSATMLSGYASYSSAHDAYYARIRAGYRMFDNVYVGPELAFLGDEYFGQSRLGVYVSGLRLGNVQFGVATGYVRDDFNKDGFYATFDTRAGF